ncbi:MAG: C-GCAxxG-C-C family protein [Clostridiales bacterium]|nr:C-GCAxxG-C-C family protein [Clostridiales bacterium]
MNIEELTAQYYLEKDCNCAETVLHAANDAFQLGLDDNAMKMIGGFGGGCGCGHLCGAVAGAIGAIGKMRIAQQAHGSDVGKVCAEYMQKYREKMGSTLCSELKPKYNVDETRCLPVCLAAVRLLDEIVSKQK